MPQLRTVCVALCQYGSVGTWASQCKWGGAVTPPIPAWYYQETVQGTLVGTEGRTLPNSAILWGTSPDGATRQEFFCLRILDSNFGSLFCHNAMSCRMVIGRKPTKRLAFSAYKKGKRRNSFHRTFFPDRSKMTVSIKGKLRASSLLIILPMRLTSCDVIYRW